MRLGKLPTERANSKEFCLTGPSSSEPPAGDLTETRVHVSRVEERLRTLDDGRNPVQAVIGFTERLIGQTFAWIEDRLDDADEERLREVEPTRRRTGNRHRRAPARGEPHDADAASTSRSDVEPGGRVRRDTATSI